MRRYRKSNNKLLIVIMLLVLSLGYAFISNSLNIMGIGGINKNTWSVIWDSESIEVTSGSTSSTLPIVDSEKTSVSYAANLAKPGDFYEFTIDAVNNGTIDSMLSVNSLLPIVYNELDEEVDLPEGLIYTIKYADGGNIKKNHLIKAGEREKYRVRIEYDKNVDEVIDEQHLRIETEIPYKPADDDAIDRDTEKYTITFNPNGGVVDEDVRKIFIGDEIGTLPIPTKTNSTFVGWYTELSGGVEVTSTTVPINNMEIFARWIDYNIINFNANGGEFSTNIDTNTIKYLDPDYYDDTLYKEPIRPGYLFVGWNELPDGTGAVTYTNEQDVLENSISLNNKTLHAQWVEARSMFIEGNNVNKKMKKLAGASNPTENTSDTSITSVERTNNKPNVSTMTNDNIVSVSDATYNAPIYMWYDNGIIYWYSDDIDPELNNYSYHIFDHLTVLTNVDLTGVKDTYVTNVGYMFNYTTSLEEVDLSQFTFSNVSNFSYMFYYASSLEDLNISNWDMRSAISVSNIFSYASSLENIVAENTKYNNTSFIMYRGNAMKSIDLKDASAGSATTMANIFENCTSLEHIDFTNFDLASVSSLQYTFQNCTNLQALDLSDWDTSLITNMYGTFYGCSSLQTLDLTGWDTHLITTFDFFLYGCSSLEAGDLSSFDTSSVTSIYNMLSGCSAIETLNISNWDMSSITDAGYFIYNTNNLKYVIANNVKFSSYSYNIFSSKTSLLTVSLDNSDAGSATSLSGMFQNCSYLNTISMKNFDTKNATSLNSMFNNATRLVNTDFSNMVTTNIQDMMYMFEYCSSLTTLDLSSFNTSNVTNMYGTFYECSSLTNLDISTWNTSKVEDFELFLGVCSSLTSIDLSHFNTSNVKSFNRMLAYNTNLSYINISGWDFSKATNVGDLFGYDSALRTVIANNTTYNALSRSIYGGNGAIETLSLRNADYSGLTDMSGIFCNMINTTTIDLNGANTTGVTNMYNMFSRDSKLVNLDISSFDTSSVTNLSWMFQECEKIVTIDVSSFDTSSATDMGGMFYGCSELTTIYATEDFVTTGVTNHSQMFQNSPKIVGGLGTKFTTAHEDKVYAHLDGGITNPGYFTANTGWRFVNSETSTGLLDQQWSYYQNGVRKENGFYTLNDLYGIPQKYYFVNGIAQLGWVRVGNDYYYFSTDDDDNNGYVNAGAYRNETKLIDNVSCDFDTDGKCTNYTGTAFYTVSLNGNGGIVNPNTINVNVNSSIGTLPTPTRTGYTFNGWYTGVTDGVLVDSTYVPSSSVTIYARWIKD